MFANGLPTNDDNFVIARIGCPRLNPVVDLVKGVVYFYCKLLSDYNCKTCSCYFQNCPVVNERIDPNKIGYDPEDPDGMRRSKKN